MKNPDGRKMTYHELVVLIEQISQHTIMHSVHNGIPTKSETHNTLLRSVEGAWAQEKEFREQAEECMRGYAEEAKELRVKNEELEEQLRVARF